MAAMSIKGGSGPYVPTPHLDMRERLSAPLEKVIDLLCSGNEENRNLALTISKYKYPYLWAVLMNYSGRVSEWTPTLMNHLMKLDIGIGCRVKYKGMDNCPVMVVVNMRQALTNSKHTNASEDASSFSYMTVLKCKWYNKSSQIFQEVEDRIECFDVLDDIEEKSKQ